VTYPNNLLLSISGTAAQIEQALHANLVFRRRKDGSAFIAVDREPSIDLAVPILQISGLTDYVLPKHFAVNGTGGSGGGGTAFARTSYRAADLRNAYLGVGSTCQSLDGTGQVIGIVGFDVFAKSDIDGYRNFRPLQTTPALTSRRWDNLRHPAPIARQRSTLRWRRPWPRVQQSSSLWRPRKLRSGFPMAILMMS
jgi:subtilase family serine protease